MCKSSCYYAYLRNGTPLCPACAAELLLDDEDTSELDALARQDPDNRGASEATDAEWWAWALSKNNLSHHSSEAA